MLLQFQSLNFESISVAEAVAESEAANEGKSSTL